MLVRVEKSQGTVTRLDWGNGKTKNDMSTDIFSQEHEEPLARGDKIP